MILGMITLIIDDVEIQVPEGTSILDAALQSGIYIPHLCTHPDLDPIEKIKPADAIYRGNERIENKKPDLFYEGCRLCVVEVDGKEGLHRACNTTVAEKMIVPEYS